MGIKRLRKYLLAFAAVVVVVWGVRYNKEKLIVLYLSAKFEPISTYEEYKIPEEPDYTDPSYWAALPTMEDTADQVPSNAGLTDTQGNADVDVFYVHPTTYVNSASWSADAKSKIEVYGIDPLFIQASVFNESARIYAPRYRQATLYSFLDTTGSGKKAFELAYKDVIKAFIHYLAYYNKGRPFIIAGHSQGSKMLIPVLRYLDRYPSEKFIVAYMPGWQVSENDFKTLKACKNATDLGCFNVWNSKRWGSELHEFIEPRRYVGSDCVNPITWKNDENPVDSSHHLGAVSKKMNGVDKAYVKAKCEGEMLWVDLPANPDYEAKRNPKNYHVVDYGLFYMDIRENVKERIAAYKEKYHDKK